MSQATIDNIPMFYPDDAPKDVSTGLKGDLVYRRQGLGRVYTDATRIANAAEQLAELPRTGYSLHCCMSGNFHAFDLIMAVIRLAAPAKVDRLDIATLGFNQQNTDRLLELLDEGTVRAVTFLCSHFFMSQETDAYTRLRYELAQRGFPCNAVRCHAKVQLFELDDGRAYVIESSANLRSCRNVEQFCLTCDRGLLDFYRGCFDQFHANATR